jgi:hypothetical protein
VSNKGKSSLKGRVSDFFLSRSKKPTRQRSTYHPSDCVADRLEACRVRSRSDGSGQDYNHNLVANGKAVDCEDRIDSFSTQISTSMSEVRIYHVSCKSNAMLICCILLSFWLAMYYIFLVLQLLVLSC